MYAMSLAEKLRGKGISVFSLNPGSQSRLPMCIRRSPELMLSIGIKTNLQTYMHGDTLDEAMKLAAVGAF